MSSLRTSSLAGRVAAGLAAAALAGCAAEPPKDPFTATGELVALSGGGSGARRACIVCHGLAGEGDGELTPRLAGLPEGYLIKQLQDYADGRRAHPEMSAIAKALRPTARLEVAAYYAALPLRTTALGASGSAGRRLYHQGDAGRGVRPCAACHGVEGEGHGAASPPLAGQPAGYMERQLDLWRVSQRRNDPQDVMLHVARALTPAEAKSVADYAASLSGAPASRVGGGSARRAASP